MMGRDPENIFAEGVVLAVEENGTRQVRMPNGHEVTAFLQGKMRDFGIPLLPGEKVLLEISPYDLSRGRVVVDSFLGSEAEKGFGSEGRSGDEDDSLGVSEASKTESTEPIVASGEAIPSGGFVVP